MRHSRRHHLAALGVAIAGSLTGCLGGDGDSSDGGSDDGDSEDDSGNGQDGSTGGEVLSLEFSDQSTDGTFATIDEFHATHDSYIVIQSMHGEELGASDVLAGEEVHEDVRIVLDPPVTMEHTLKAIAYRHGRVHRIVRTAKTSRGWPN